MILQPITLSFPYDLPDNKIFGNRHNIFKTPIGLDVNEGDQEDFYREILNESL